MCGALPRISRPLPPRAPEGVDAAELVPVPVPVPMGISDVANAKYFAVPKGTFVIGVFVKQRCV